MATKKPSTVKQWRQWYSEQITKKWPKPLRPHARNQWYAYLNGGCVYFGKLDDPDEALANYHRYLATGGKSEAGNGLTLEELIAIYKADAEERNEAGNMSDRVLQHIRQATDQLVRVVSPNRTVDSLDSDDFKKAANYLKSRKTKAGKLVRPRTVKNYISAIRSMFAWADIRKKIDSLPDYGGEFSAPDTMEIKRDREKNATDRFIDREDILAMLDAANPQLRLAILLGINCAFYGEDSLSIELKHFKHRGGIHYHEFSRVKNAYRRKGVLWPETIQALEDYKAIREPFTDTDIVFLNQLHVPYDPLGHGLRKKFNRLAESVNVKTTNVSVGSLRHTFATVANDYADAHGGEKIVSLIMGHETENTQTKRYSQRTLGELERIKKVTDAVHRWLYDGIEPWVKE